MRFDLEWSQDPGHGAWRIVLQLLRVGVASAARIGQRIDRDE